jgi:organic radical activating enzyme
MGHMADKSSQLHILNDSHNSEKRWAFSEILSNPAVKKRFETVRKYFFLRESTYDMSNRCNLRCDGCYYFEGDKQFAKENRQPEAWRKLMQQEKARGITYVVLAGAEPAMVPELLEVCYQEIDLGCIATNGVRPIPDSVGYKIHISVWGNDKTSERVRNHKNLLSKQIDAYKGNEQAVFVYTFTKQNIAEIYQVMDFLAPHQAKVTFNVFSSPLGYGGDLRLDAHGFAQVQATMLDVMEKFPENVLFSPYNAVVHTHPQSLHGLFSCTYPRANPSNFVGLGRSFRQYRTDLSWDKKVACCVPDTDCEDCRHYASGSAVVTSRMQRHAGDPVSFRAWLDYVDTYLAVWVTGYQKHENLCKHPVPPPGFDLIERQI